MSPILEQVESELKINFDNYWSLFFMSGESDATSHEWARSQMIEVCEALFWIAFEKPKRIKNVDRFVLGEWLERIRSGRSYYESKEDLLLLLAFGCQWTPDRICYALNLPKSAFYFRLFHAIRLRSAEFRGASGHLTELCAHFDLRLPEFLLAEQAGEKLHASVHEMMSSHAETCQRCAKLKDFSQELAELVNQTWNQSSPVGVVSEALQPFAQARANPIKRTVWSRIPPWTRTLLAALVVGVLAFLAFKNL